MADTPLTVDALNAYMDEALRQLTKAYITGGIKIGFNPDNLLKYETAGAYDNSALDTVEYNYAAIGAYITKLDTTLRQRVLSDPNYGIARWQGFASDVASDISQQTGFAWDSSYLVNAPSSAVLAAKSTAQKILPWVGSGLLLYFLLPVVAPIAINLLSRRPSRTES